MSKSQASNGRPDHGVAPVQYRRGADIAPVSTWTGAKAAALQAASRSSQEAFANQLGVNIRTVARWHENPDTELRPATSGMLDTVLSSAACDVQERFVMLVEEKRGPEPQNAKAPVVEVTDIGGDLGDDEDMLRRHFLRSSAAAITAAALPGLGSSRRTPRLNAANVGELETVTEAQRRLYHVVPARSMWASVAAHLRMLVDLIRSPQPEQVRRQLAGLGGEAAGLLAWLALDLGDERGRERSHDIALSLTAEAGDPALDAYVRGFRSQVRQLEGRPRAALALAEQAVETAGASQAGGVPALLRSLQAVALAEVKDERGTMLALAAAETALDRGTADEPAWMYKFDHTRLTAVRGDCMLRLDQPQHAEIAFKDALAEITHKGGRFEVELLTGLARATARQGQVEEACRLGMQSLDLAASGSELGFGRVRQLRQELDRWYDSDAVAALDSRLALA